MKHPTPEELLSALEGDESSETLQSHLNECPQCARLVAGWMITIKALKRDEDLDIKATRAVLSRSGWRCSAAAAIILLLALGFGVGRLTALSRNSFKEQVLAQVRADLLAAIAKDQKTPNAFAEGFRSEFKQLSENQAAEQRQRTRDLENLVQSLRDKSDVNQREFMAVLQEIQQQHQLDYISLRRDLETAVTMADKDLMQNRRQLTQLAATLETAKN